nr:type III polyketide synthase [Alsobacter ponti]
MIGVATAVPPYELDQREVTARAHGIFGGRFADFERMARVFGTAGIRRRWAARPLAWYDEPGGWPERTAAYLEAGEALFAEAAERVLSKAGFTGRDVDTVVTISSTGIATPSLEARAARRLGLRPETSRVPVFGLGCAGGVTGLGLAARLAEARPGSLVLVVAMELCTLAFRNDALSKANIVATALFGDGAAAALVRAGGGDSGVAVIEGSGEHQWPDTLDIMGWDAEAEGLGVIFARAIPPFAEENFAGAMDAILARLGLRRDEVGRFVCHPGGAKVIEALERALGLDQGSLDHEREVLADNGNMSAPTALFVLQRALDAGLSGRAVLTAMGPGFTASAVSLIAGRA